MVGGLITHLLRGLHRSEDLLNHTIVVVDFLTAYKMKRMNGVSVRESGELYWSFRKEEVAQVLGILAQLPGNGSSAQMGSSSTEVLADHRWVFM